MTTQHEFPPVDLDCQIAAALLTNGLEASGLRVMRSFDLRTAACVPRAEVPCPHHGSVPCSCQLVILLVYGVNGSPASVVAHGYDNQTWFSLVDDPARPADPGIGHLVHQAFDALVPWTSKPGAVAPAAST